MRFNTRNALVPEPLWAEPLKTRLNLMKNLLVGGFSWPSSFLNNSYFHENDKYFEKNKCFTYYINVLGRFSYTRNDLVQEPLWAEPLKKTPKKLIARSNLARITPIPLICC